jgi:hypothetical protein
MAAATSLILATVILVRFILQGHAMLVDLLQLQQHPQLVSPQRLHPRRIIGVQPSQGGQGFGRANNLGVGVVGVLRHYVQSHRCAGLHRFLAPATAWPNHFAQADCGWLRIGS